MPFVFTVNSQETNITYEAETVAEGMAIRTSAEMVKALADLASVEDTESTSTADNTTVAPAAEAPARRTRGPNKPKNQPAPETATAPPPAPIPATAAPTPPVPPLATAPAPVAPPPAPAADDGSIPPFLQRTAPPAPPAPPSIILGPKIRAHIESQAGDDAAKKQWLTWLSSPGIALVVPSASFDEAMGVLQYTTDAQCGGVAKALGVTG